MATIFMCGDTGQTFLLDKVQETLAAQGHEVRRGPLNVPGTIRHYPADERRQLLADADVAVFTTRHAVSRALMADAPMLRGVCFPVIGVESLDLAAANELGIIVGHGAVPQNVTGMAEATVMLVLMLLYDVETNVERMKQGLWRRPRHSSRELAGKTIGMLGFGRIARETAARLRPFGVRLIATPSPRTRSEDMPRDVEAVDLATLAAQSDVLCVLTGLTPETRGMIGAAQLSGMKPDAYIVNTGRGEVIDEAALYAHLSAGRIAGAALDTFTTEPLPADSPLRTLRNVILTPHCVGHTVEAEEAFVPAMVENIRRILAGELPLYCKNPEAEDAWRRRIAQLPAPVATPTPAVGA